MIFDFWANMKRGEKIHPADKSIFFRSRDNKNGFCTSCLPASYAGPLKTAKIVLLYLSPGLSDQDEKDARSKKGQDYYQKAWLGSERFPSHHSPAVRWFESRTKWLTEDGRLDMEDIYRNVAILNIGAYHSKNISCYKSLLALPSSRISLDWAQQTLFPQAEAKKRVVICMRSASAWGLSSSENYDGYLFAPETTMGGFFCKTDRNKKIKKMVRDFIYQTAI